MAQTAKLFCLFAFVVFAFANRSQAAPDVETYELARGDMSLRLTNYGATLLSVVLPDKNGKLDDVVLAFDSIDSYRNDSVYFGNVVGRVANRIGKAQFGLNGVFYKLISNDGRNMLHGGKQGYGDVIWNVESYQKDSHITFTYDSFDGEQGFPGDLAISVTYMFIETNKLGVKMTAKALNKPTPVNLAQHSYWNLDGHTSGDILSHNIKLFASQFTPVDEELIPTGEIAAVDGTPYDFMAPRQVGGRLKDLPNGYDMNYVIDDTGSKHLKKVAEVYGSVSGRKMELWSNQPGVQFYTSGQLTSVKGKGGFVYTKFAGLCLESQKFPDSVNHPNFPAEILNPGETYEHVMVYRFTVHSA